jgi:Ser/Thr protein kinase RdoA (MazF antagonist)
VHYAGHPDYNDIFVEIGGLARKLHTLAMPGYGALCSPQHADNSAYVSALIAYALERFLYFGADPELAERLRETLGRGFAAIVPASGPAVFAHDDLHPGNILVVEEAGRLSLSGLIDFGNARAQSAVMDVAKTIFICEHMAPGSGPAILRGYGAIDHPAPTEALAYYTTLHRIIMWWWLRKVGVLATPDTPSELIDALWEAVAAP